MKLVWNLVRKDLNKNKVITVSLTAFLFLSSFLMSGGMRITGTMISALSGLNKIAMPPDYVQMHKGSYDTEAWDNFVNEEYGIEEALVVEMLDIENGAIFLNGESLEKCLMENGFVTQNDEFDFLLDQNNEIALIEKGEIGVPVYYAEEYHVKVGDRIVLREGAYQKELRVAKIIRDSTMNSALTYSKRFLINKEDQKELSKQMGEWEYCFEFLLDKDFSAAKLKTQYTKAGLPTNGVAVTAGIFRMLNVFSYGLVALVVLAISTILIAMSILSLSYIVRATMEEERQTIGEMKAVGIPIKEINRIYLMKYSILLILSGVFGYLASIPFGDFLSSSIVRYCGPGRETWMKWIFPACGVLVLAMLVFAWCKKQIGRFIGKTVMELRRGEEQTKKEGHINLPKNGFRAVNLELAARELLCYWKEYLVVFIVFLFSSFLLLLPMNMNDTIDNPDFLTYMGVGKSDIRIDIQYTENRDSIKDAVVAYLDGDQDIKKYAVYENGYVLAENAEGEVESLRVQNGVFSAFPLQYLEGRAPENKNEIALSYLNAKEFDKETGDYIEVSYGDLVRELVVCGIYQDITYGGKTAKAKVEFQKQDREGYTIYLNLEKEKLIDLKIADMRLRFEDCKITPVNEFVFQTLGGVIRNMRLVETASFLIAMLFILFITMMFLELVTAKEHSMIAIKKAMGFTSYEIRIQMAVRILIVQLMAIITGTILANTLGEVLFAGMLSAAGAARIQFYINPFKAYLRYPMMQLGLAAASTYVGTRSIRTFHIRDQIME